MLRLNVNEQVMFKLTEFGLKYWEEKGLPYIERDGDQEMFVMPLWEFMQVFGDCYHMNDYNLPTLNNMLYLKDK